MNSNRFLTTFTRTVLCAGSLALLLPGATLAAGAIADGTLVRIASNSIEPGWFQGKVKRDPRGCWMVHLDKATKDQYTMLALMVVDRLEVGRAGVWTAIDLPPVIKAQPPHCLEEGSD